MAELLPQDEIREQISDYVLLMLGAPVVEVHMDQQQLNLAINKAFRIFENYAPDDYFNFFIFTPTIGKNVYTLAEVDEQIRKSFEINNPNVNTTSGLAQNLPPEVKAISQIFYLNQPESSEFFIAELDGSVVIDPDRFDPRGPAWGAIGPWAVWKQYEEMFARWSSQWGGWQRINESEFMLFPVPRRDHKVVIKYLPVTREWIEIHQFLEEYALAFAKQIEGGLRKKYQTIASPGGGSVLDGTEMYQQGKEEQMKLEEDLIIKFSPPPPIVTG